LDGTIDLRKKKKEQVTEMLEAKGYDKINGDEDYKYLVKMPMDSVTEENVARLLAEKAAKEAELKIVKETTIHQMWLMELSKLQDSYTGYKEERMRLMSGEVEKGKKTVKKTVVRKKAPVA
jgi:DNA topoisomerase-2